MYRITNQLCFAEFDNNNNKVDVPFFFKSKRHTKLCSLLPAERLNCTILPIIPSMRHVNIRDLYPLPLSTTGSKANDTRDERLRKIYSAVFTRHITISSHVNASLIEM